MFIEFPFYGPRLLKTANPSLKLKREVCMRFQRSPWLLIPVYLVLFSTAFADEGMWTFDNPPRQTLKEKYGFGITEPWLEHVRLSSVRFMDGGSGSFVSPNGLVMTNHHVAVGQLQKLSTAENDYVKTGFYAFSQSDEVQCPDLEINVLVEMVDVTTRVRNSVGSGYNAWQALKAKEMEIATIENESKEKTGLKSEVVDLYRGGEYWLYRYKKYTDVRLVMAPERQVAFYGGDSDNFTFPRHDLDVAFFRVYENGRPVRAEHYLKWNTRGADEDELVFVSGHPGSTNRLYTVSQLEYQRDVYYPLLLQYLHKRIEILKRYMALGPEQNRRGLVQLFGLENSRKAITGEYEGLQDQDWFVKKQTEEAKLRRLVASKSEWKRAYGDAWKIIDKAVNRQREQARPTFFRRLIGSRLYGIADKIVFYSREIEKPDVDRLDGFHGSQLEELKFYLFSHAPIYKDLEEANLAGCLAMCVEALGSEDEFLKNVLRGNTPENTAARLIGRTKLQSVEFRRALIEGGRAAVDTCSDPLIELARAQESMVREGIAWKKEVVESALDAGSEKIAHALFAVYGKERSPDATSTLRLAFGAVKGYPMNGTVAPCKTTLYGLYDRALSFNGKGEFELPARFWERKDSLDLATQVNFVSTCDIIGGNSGSPVVNRAGEVIGLIFDGNMESLPGRFGYDDAKNRAVSVHTAYIVEALRKLYGAGVLADELEGR
jgi:hypothetical protein